MHFTLHREFQTTKVETSSKIVKQVELALEVNAISVLKEVRNFQRMSYSLC